MDFKKHYNNDYTFTEKNLMDGQTDEVNFRLASQLLTRHPMRINFPALLGTKMRSSLLLKIINNTFSLYKELLKHKSYKFHSISINNRKPPKEDFV